MALGRTIVSRFGSSVKATYHKVTEVVLYPRRGRGTLMLSGFASKTQSDAGADALTEHPFTLGAGDMAALAGGSVLAAVQQKHDTSAWPAEVIAALETVTRYDVIGEGAYSFIKAIPAHVENPAYAPAREKVVNTPRTITQTTEEPNPNYAAPAEGEPESPDNTPTIQTTKIVPNPDFDPAWETVPATIEAPGEWAGAETV